MQLRKVQKFFLKFFFVIQPSFLSHRLFLAGLSECGVTQWLICSLCLLSIVAILSKSVLYVFGLCYLESVALEKPFEKAEIEKH